MNLEHSPARQSSGTSVQTVAEFCDDNRISRSKLYQLFEAGLGPRVMRVGTKVLISAEAAAEWRRSLENKSAATT